VQVAVPVPLRRTFTYLWPDIAPEPQAGVRVRVPFGRRRLTGVVVETAPTVGEPPRRLRLVESILDVEPALPAPLLKLAAFTAEHYVAPLGEVLRAFLPAGLGSRWREERSGEALPNIVTWVLRGAEVGGSPPEEGTARRRQRAPARERVLALLEEAGGGLPLDRLRAAGASAAVIRSLLRRAEVRLEKRQEPPSIATVQVTDPLQHGGQFDPGADPEGDLDPAQTAAVHALVAAVHGRRAERFLLFGVTGSGKTEVYLRAAAAALEAGHGVLILVPEIALTPALVGRLARRFGDRLAVLHSGLSPRRRAAAWGRLRRGEARLALGARSALFAPLARLGLIIVDEEQEATYKQEETPRYNARDLALVRGRIESCPVVLVSATPALETYARAMAGRDRILRLPRRVAGRPLPVVRIVDRRAEFRSAGRVELLSPVLTEALADIGREGSQAMLLVHRRGWAAFLLCRACGDPIRCSACSVSLTLHRADRRLACHYCGRTRALPAACPTCSERALQEIGAGTERVEEELHRVAPGLRVLRMDADTVRGAGGHARLLARFAAGEADVLVGTRMVAKGHDFPGVRLVGILGGDALLGFPDFRAAEWTFQTVTQAAGRAGRGMDPGQVVLQAFAADHYALRHAAAHDAEGFYAAEDRFRRALLYPPHAVLAAVRVRHRNEKRAAARIAALAADLRADPDAGEHLRILGPAPAPLARLRTYHRFHLLLKARSRRRLSAVLHRLAARLEQDRVPPGEVACDVDPSSLL